MSYLFECCEPGLNAYYTTQSQIKFEKEGKAAKVALQYNEFDSPMQFVMATLQTWRLYRHSRGLSNTNCCRTCLYDSSHVPPRTNNDFGAALIMST
jgi:hypothetical protein